MQNVKDFFKKSPVTATLLVLTVLYFVVIQVRFLGYATSTNAVFLSGGLNGYHLRQHPADFWRLLSPLFVHIGWEHLIFNMVTLYFVGPIAEQWWGAWRFLTLYLLAGLMGNLFIILFTPNVVAAGASGSLFGILAAVSVVGYFGSHPFLKQVGRNFQILILLNLAFNLFMPNLSLAGHIGGAIGGAICAIFLKSDYAPDVFTKKQSWLALTAYVALAICLLIVFIVR